MLGENEWVLSGETELRLAARALGPRRVRLLVVACCRTVLPVLRDCDPATARAALEAVEAFADTGKTKAALKRARQAVREIRDRLNLSVDRAPYLSTDDPQVLWAVEVAATENVPDAAIPEVLTSVLQRESIREETAKRRLYGFYRDVAGTPPSLAFDPAWRTSTAIALAQQMYETRDFSALPILADALQDAGCESDSVLSHCRGPDKPNNGFPAGIPTAPFVHVRGCWVVDLVLGKG